MKAKAIKQKHTKNTPKDEKSSNRPIKKWFSSLAPKKKIAIIVGLAILLMLIWALSSSIAFRNKRENCDGRLDFFCELGAPVANTNDFKGKTVKEVKELADKLGIKYEIDDYPDVYDPDSEGIQTVDEIDGVYNQNGDFVPEFNNYRREGLSLYKGWSIKISLNKTDRQLKDETECKAKGGYTYDYQNGKVDCHKTQETICREQGKIYYKSKCYANQEEVDEAKRWEEAHSACKRYGSNGYAKTLTDCYVGNEYKGKVDGSEEPKQTEEKPKNDESSNTDSGSSSSSSSSQSDGESLPDDIDPYDIKALCERTLKSVGYSNSISVTNHYAMGYPPYIYVIVGTLKGKDAVQCQANWSSWTVKSLTINGQKVYGE